MKKTARFDLLKRIYRSIVPRHRPDRFLDILDRSNVNIGPDVQISHRILFKGDYPISIGMNCVLNEGISLDANNGPITIGEGCILEHHARIHSSGEGIHIGAGTLIGADACLNADNGGLTLGENCRVGAHVSMHGNGNGVHISSECHIGANSTFDALGGEIFLGEKTTTGSNCVVVGTGRGVHVQANCDFQHGVTLDAQGGYIRIDQFSGAGPYAIIYGHGGMTIGKYCAIAGQTVLIPANHRFDRMDIPIRQQGVTAVGISVGDDVWIGTQCVVLDGAKIGRGCVIGAGSIVRGTLPDYCVAVGIPCRILRVRTQ
jgi:acetyltransferase-like isoleucine patch superfamily enzyme